MTWEETISAIRSDPSKYEAIWKSIQSNMMLSGFDVSDEDAIRGLEQALNQPELVFKP